MSLCHKHLNLTKLHFVSLRICRDYLSNNTLSDKITTLCADASNRDALRACATHVSISQKYVCIQSFAIFLEARRFVSLWYFGLSVCGISLHHRNGFQKCKHSREICGL